MAAEIDGVMRGKDIEVPSPGIVPVEPDAAVTLDAAVHLVVHEGPQVLVDVGPLAEAEAAVDVACHDRHVLQMAFAPFVADRAVVGMIGHQPLDDCWRGMPLPRGHRRRGAFPRRPGSCRT